MDEELEKLVAKAKAYVDGLTPAERRAMRREQIERIVAAEMAMGDEGTRTVPI